MQIGQNLSAPWYNALKLYWAEADQVALAQAVAQARQQHPVCPAESQVFAALNHVAPDQVRVVILGQDPYHGPGQAHGYAFSVPDNVKFPPSLRNILHELCADLNLAMPISGDLRPWADQGVLLLNAVLTVEEGNAASHAALGWASFSDAVLRLLNQQQQPIVFMLWGQFAQRKAAFIDTQRHLVLTAAHPSPLSANRGGWFGQQHFSQANAWLKTRGLPTINWSLPTSPQLL
ncbi:MAG: uracil-DNA glycosylase [Moraxellaceae bacterium]|nr:uracil-DNA glycosylase [Moraxellaceae bacterium]